MHPLRLVGFTQADTRHLVTPAAVNELVSVAVSKMADACLLPSLSLFSIRILECYGCLCIK